MRMLVSFVVVIVVTILSTAAFAAQKKVLVISDIDDTIKSSHVLNPVRAALRVTNYSLRFSGMAQLYQLIFYQENTQTRFVYLSNAPQKIAGVGALQLAHETFIRHNKFPNGLVSLKDDFFEKNHKIDEIRRLTDLEKPDQVIFIGDNGERDVEIYDQASIELLAKGIAVVTFIHQIYKTTPSLFDGPFYPEVGKKLKRDQVGFVTPVEISIELHKLGLLDSTAKNWMIENVAPYIASEKFFNLDTIGNITFPSYKKCADFVWKWQITAQLAPLVKKIKSQCR